ncbi:hypothetical protein SeMB42_g01961 [Synchytrium endobioticum]|uniref:Signal peptidase subunit 3 n=1 Tax=Synchytrium endobioticum TaxID=286115 RepID=A0A507D3V3_9FUNG|nr:hypothetical protein SeLEV6574_g03539 [Synchytrium endobioticum]TPX51315.1 hypothetical protein SeMB42_g01961 [Synchytrium endobioticum]
MLALYGQSSTSIHVKDVMVKLGRIGNPYDRASPISEEGIIDFNLDADLRSVFNWNTKQLFVYVLAEFETPANDTSAVVVWDDIIQRREKALIRLKGQRGEYRVSDMNHKLSKDKARLSFHYNVIPHVGLLQWFQTNAANEFTFPASRA